jgi:hypothetical protein
VNRRKLLKTLLVLAAVAWLALNLDGKPGAAPVQGEALDMLQAFAPDFGIKEALDVIPLGSKHLFVPFEYGDGQRGNGFLIWERFKWRVSSAITDNSPVVWLSGLSDHARKAIVWNVAPEKNVTELSFYFIAERQAGHSGKQVIYFPRIQMEKKILPENISYGVMELPEEWEQLSRLNTRSYIGWLFRKGNDDDSNSPVAGDSRAMTTGKTITRHIRLINESELD